MYHESYVCMISKCAENCEGWVTVKLGIIMDYELLLALVKRYGN